MVNTEIRLIIFFAAKYGEAVYSQQKQDWELTVAQMAKHVPRMQETRVRSLGWEDSPGEGNGTPLQYSCLENPMDGGAW